MELTMKEQEIRNIFKPEVITYLEKQDKINIESDRKHLVYYRISKRIKPTELSSFLEQATKIVRLFNKDIF